MSTLAVRLAVSAAVASVIMTGIEAWRTRQILTAGVVQVPPPPADEEVGSPVPRLAEPPHAVVESQPVKAKVAPNPRAMARIHGRVLGQSIEGLTVDIADVDRRYEAAVEPDGDFAMNLPPGRYTVMASAGDDVGEAQVDDLVEDEDREVTVMLVPGVSIAGRVDGCDGPCGEVSIGAKPSGAAFEMWSASSTPDGAFAIDGLLPGRTYDLTFQANEMRRLVVRALPAPQRDRVVTLQTPPTLSGGFGTVPGQKCPMTSVLVSGKNGGYQQVDFDRHCNFHVEALPDADSIHVQATGTGWHFEVDVAIPDRGDPAFLCLREPCRVSEPEPEASLQVVFSGKPAGRVNVWTTSSAGGSGASYFSASEPCILSHLTPTTGVTVNVSTEHCQSQRLTVDLYPGTNTIPFHCQPARTIQGMLRMKGGQAVATSARVRCSAALEGTDVRRSFFVLECPERQATIEYQASPEHPWQTAAVPPGSADSVAFLDIVAD